MNPNDTRLIEQRDFERVSGLPIGYFDEPLWRRVQRRLFWAAVIACLAFIFYVGGTQPWASN